MLAILKEPFVFFIFVLKYIRSGGKLKAPDKIMDKTESVILHKSGYMEINYANPQVRKNITHQMRQYSKIKVNKK